VTQLQYSLLHPEYGDATISDMITWAVDEYTTNRDEDNVDVMWYWYDEWMRLISLRKQEIEDARGT